MEITVKPEHKPALRSSIMEYDGTLYLMIHRQQAVVKLTQSSFQALPPYDYEFLEAHANPWYGTVTLDNTSDNRG